MSVPDSKATVLVVDDESSIRELVTEKLRSAGYSVLEASSGPEALDICARRQCRIDLLLTDLIMPGMTGRALADAVTAQCRIPVIFMSGYIDGPRSASLAQDVPFIQKPLDWEKLKKMIRDALASEK